MYQPDTTTFEGRQWDGLVRSGSRRARVLLTVDITSPRSGQYHQTFRAKAWESRSGEQMVTLDLNDGDWASNRYPTKVLHVNMQQGTMAPARNMSDERMLYAAKAAVRACLGQPVQPSAGSVAVAASNHCGACGAELTHPVSKELGIGPECAKRLGYQHHYGSSKTLTGTAKRKSNSSTAALALPGSRHAAVLAGEAATAPPTQLGADDSMATALPVSDAELVASLEATCGQLQRRANAAANAGAHDKAQQLYDQLDSARAALGKARRDLQLGAGATP